MSKYEIFATHADAAGEKLVPRFATQNQYGVARRDPDEVRAVFQRMQKLFLGVAEARAVRAPGDSE